MEIFKVGCASAMIFGGVVPYIPQYREIQRSENTEGFSLYVCLALLVANILRILFWFGHPYELPLLAQSIIMNVAMLAMVHLCVYVRNKTMIIKGKDRIFTDFDARYFWEWTDFLSYIEFIVLFTTFSGFLIFLFKEHGTFVESIGFASVFIEAMLGTPQFYRNFVNKSTVGMSKKMVCMWTMGDIYKTIYFLLRDAPKQFWVCGCLQIGVDLAIFVQVFLYRRAPFLRSKPVSSFQ